MLNVHENTGHGKVHRVVNGTFADAAAREAATGFTADRVEGVYRQLDNDSLWWVAAVASGVPAWRLIGHVDPGTRTVLSPDILSGTDYEVLGSWVNNAANGFPIIFLEETFTSTVTFQLVADQPVLVGSQIEFFLKSANPATFQGVVGTYIVGLSGLNTNGQWSRVIATYVDSDTWVLTGDLVL